jgi:hypothetical protein
LARDYRRRLDDRCAACPARDNRAVIVRSLRDDDQSWKVATLVHGWGATTVARLGELVDVASLPGFVAADEHERVGLITYAERGDGIEVVTIQALTPGRGIGRALDGRRLRARHEAGGGADLADHHERQCASLRVLPTVGHGPQPADQRRRGQVALGQAIDSGRRQ